MFDIATPIPTPSAGVVSPATVQRIEARFSPPNTSLPIGAYARYYWASDSIVEGLFVRSTPTNPPGVHIVSKSDAPRAADGGCFIIRVKYSLASDNLQQSCGSRR